MSSIIEKKEEYVLTKAQFDKLQKNGKLIVGATYKIKDDPTVQDLIDGVEISKKAEQDKNGEVINTTYRRVDDSYSKSDIDLITTGNATEVLSIKQNVEANTLSIKNLQDKVTELQSAIETKVQTVSEIPETMQAGEYVYLRIGE